MYKKKKINTCYTQRYSHLCGSFECSCTHAHLWPEEPEKKSCSGGFSFPFTPPTSLGVGLTPPGGGGKSSWKVPTAQLHALEGKLTLVFWSFWWLLQSSPWKCSSHALTWWLTLSEAWQPILAPLLGRLWALPCHLFLICGQILVMETTTILDLSRLWACQLKPG